MCERESENGLLQQLLDDENATSDHLAGLTVDQIMNFWKYIIDEQESGLDNTELQFLLCGIQETILRGVVVEYFRSAQKLGLAEDLLQLFKDENLITELLGQPEDGCLDSQEIRLLVKPSLPECTENKPTQYNPQNKQQGDGSSEQSGSDSSKYERLLRDMLSKVYHERQEGAIELYKKYWREKSKINLNRLCSLAPRRRNKLVIDVTNTKFTFVVVSLSKFYKNTCYYN